MSTAGPPDDVPVIRQDGSGRLHAQAEELPDQPAVLAHACLLAGLQVRGTAEDAGVTGRVRGGWTLEFTCQGHAFAIRTDYHAGVMLYSANGPDCPRCYYGMW